MILDTAAWGRLSEQARKAWCNVVRLHGFDPHDVGFPLEIEQRPEGAVMIVWKMLRDPPDRLVILRQECPGDEHWHSHVIADVIYRRCEVPVHADIGIPKWCR